MLNISTNYNINFGAGAPKTPAYKRMLTNYENYEQKRGAKKFKWDKSDRVFFSVIELLGVTAIELIFFFARLPDVSYYYGHPRVRVKQTQEYVEQYNKAKQLYKGGELLDVEYKEELNKLLPEYREIIDETYTKMDNVIQLRILRSMPDAPKNPKTGKYIYQITAGDGRAVVNVQQ